MRHGCHSDCVSLAPENRQYNFIATIVYTTRPTRIFTKRNWFFSLWPFWRCVVRSMVRTDCIFTYNTAPPNVRQCLRVRNKKKTKIVYEQWTSFNMNRFGSVIHFISLLPLLFFLLSLVHSLAYDTRTMCEKRFDCVRLSTPKSIYRTMTESFALCRQNYIGRKNVRRILPFLFLRRVFLSRQFWLLRRRFWFSARKQRQQQRTARTTRYETEWFFPWREMRQMLLLPTNDTINIDVRMGDASSQSSKHHGPTTDPIRAAQNIK